jgi:hypothetical protein
LDDRSRSTIRHKRDRTKIFKSDADSDSEMIKSYTTHYSTRRKLYNDHTEVGPVNAQNCLEFEVLNEENQSIKEVEAEQERVFIKYLKYYR